MIMNKLLFLILFSSSCYSWETNLCRDSRDERIASLKEFGKTAQQYLYENGEIPDLCNISVPELTKDVPFALSDYLVCGSSAYDEVYYSCFLESSKEKQVEEMCKFTLSTGAIECGGITAVFDQE